jgi:hypothetical protein
MGNPDQAGILAIPKGVYPKHEYNSALYIQPLAHHQLFYANGVYAIHIQNRGSTSFPAVMTAGVALKALVDDRCPILARQYFKLTIGDFWRKQFDKTFAVADEEFSFKKHEPRSNKAFVAAEAEMWIAAFQCLEAINTAGRWNFPSPAINLGAGLVGLVQEGLMIAWTMKSSGMTNAHKQALPEQQTINAKLKKQENPFPESSFTHAFVKTCLKMSEDSEEFGKRWKRLVTAKSEYLEIWRTSKPIVIDKLTGVPLDKRQRPRKKSM